MHWPLSQSLSAMIVHYSGRLMKTITILTYIIYILYSQTRILNRPSMLHNTMPMPDLGYVYNVFMHGYIIGIKEKEVV